MMTQEQIKLLTESIAQMRESVHTLAQDLGTRVLDGTPFAIIGEYASPDSVEPVTLIYGEWAGYGRCFRALSIQPHHFGGVFTMSAESAERAIARLKADGDESKLINPRRVHIRTLKQDRLKELLEVIAHLEGALRVGEPPSDARV